MLSTSGYAVLTADSEDVLASTSTVHICKTLDALTLTSGFILNLVFSTCWVAGCTVQRQGTLTLAFASLGVVREAHFALALTLRNLLVGPTGCDTLGAVNRDDVVVGALAGAVVSLSCESVCAFTLAACTFDLVFTTAFIAAFTIQRESLGAGATVS